MDTINLAESDGLPPIEWAFVRDQLDTGVPPAPTANTTSRRTTWLTTVNPDGSPHVSAVGALWVDGSFWFQTGKGTRKGRNVARDPRCSVAVSVKDADVVLEGEATQVTDRPTIERIAKAFADQGWPAEVHESGEGITAPYNAPTLGPAPWYVYRITPRSATVVTTIEPGGSTRFRF
jgi:PPOX class probable F420-dependent enzyme